MPGTGAEIPATSAMFMHEPSRTLDTLVPCFRFQKFGEAIPYEITVSEFFARYLSITPDAAIDAHHEHRFIRFLVVMVFPMTRHVIDCIIEALIKRSNCRCLWRRDPFIEHGVIRCNDLGAGERMLRGLPFECALIKWQKPKPNIDFVAN